VEVRWQVVEEIRERSMDWLRSNHMVVIEHKCNLVWKGSKIIDPDSQDGFYGWKR